MTERVAIIGGGVVGLTLALRFAQRGSAVTVYEAAPQLGGLADAWELGPIRWDRHYHVTLLSDLATRALAAELGIDDYRWIRTRTGFFTDGKLHSLSDALEFLRFPPLGLIDKMRLAATILYASRIRDGRRLEAIPIERWLRRLSGNRTTEKIWLPLLRAKLGTNVSRASAAFLWAIIARMYAARRSGLKTEMFGYAPGGYARIIEAFTNRLREFGVTLRTASAIERVVNDGGSPLVVTATETQAFDRVVITASAPIAAKLVPQLRDDERAKLEAIAYQGIVCASVLLGNALAPYYVTNITDPVPFSAVIEMTALVEPGELNGNHLVYLPKYVPSDDPAFHLDDEAIRTQFLAGLARMYPHFRIEDVRAFRVSRARFVTPVTTLHYSDLVTPFLTSVPGVALVNSSQIVNGTLNVNESILLAERAAAELTGVAGGARRAA